MIYMHRNQPLSEVEYYAQLEAFLALEKLRCFIDHFLYQFQKIVHSIASIVLWRLVLLVLKRILAIVKAGLKYFLIELPVPVLGFLYILHFGRAFLTLIDFFQDRDNKNLVEITKFLYACFKIFISFLMITLLLALLIHGMAPVGIMAYVYFKILFRIYTFSKFGISLLVLGFSYYKLKAYGDDVEHAWLKAHYQANAQKHMHILVLGTPIVVLLTVVSVFGVGLGPIGLAMVIVLAGLLLALDIAKAIYFYNLPCIIPEPTQGSLAQQNSFIDYASQDYYYRKCRTARLIEIKSPENSQANKIYLIKEIVVKIISLQAKLKNCSASSCSFFSEKPKIQKKILDLKHVVSTLVNEGDEESRSLFKGVIEALERDYNKIKENKTLDLDKAIENFITDLKKSKVNELNFLKEFLKTENDILKQKGFNSQGFQQSFFKKVGDCEDIARACQAQVQKPDDDASTVISRQTTRYEASGG